LREQEEFVSTYFNNCALRSEPINLEELKKQFNYTFKDTAEARSEEFFYVMNSYIENTAQTKSWNSRYKDEWVRVMEGLRTYKSSTNWSSLNEAYMNGYLQFLAKTMLNEKIKKNLEKLREFLNWAKLKKYPVNDDFFLYKPKLQSSHKEVRYLTIEEVSKLIGLDLSSRIALEQTRDFFIFQCFTALRYSDLQKLKKTNIIQEGDGYYLDTLTTKDKDRINFRLAKPAVAIYLKYIDYEYDNGVLFPILTNQKYNEHLKELGAVAEIEGEYVSLEDKKVLGLYLGILHTENSVSNKLIDTELLKNTNIGYKSVDEYEYFNSYEKHFKYIFDNMNFESIEDYFASLLNNEIIVKLNREYNFNPKEFISNKQLVKK
jgi:integrase